MTSLVKQASAKAAALRLEQATCFGCGNRQGLKHFHMNIKVRVGNGRLTTRGAGRIDLCPTCWKDANAGAHRHSRPRLEAAS